jgi:hypothetical protein
LARQDPAASNKHTTRYFIFLWTGETFVFRFYNFYSIFRVEGRIVLFNSEGGDSKFLRNVGNDIPDYKASYTRIHES